MALTVDRRAIGRGIAAYVAIAAPCGLLIALLGGSDQAGHESNLWIAAALIIIVIAPLAGGAVAGAAQPTPLLHGAVAVGVPAMAFLVVRVAVGVARHSLTANQAVTFLLYLVVFTALGMLGGYLGFRRRQHLV